MNTAANITDPSNTFRMSSRLPNETDVLRLAHVALVRMTYDGQFGDREIATITYLDEAGVAIATPSKRVDQEVRVFLRELLELRFTGWESAEGARGHFEWNVQTDVLQHVHEVRVIAYDTVQISNPAS